MSVITDPAAESSSAVGYPVRCMARPLRVVAPLALACAAAAALAPAACRNATEVTLDVRTLAPGLKCADLRRVTIVVAADPHTAETNLENGFASAEVRASCDAEDRVGTLVVTPSGDTGAVVVAAAIDDGADCRKSAAYKGCIVARRVFSFTKHAGLVLPITLERSCLDVPCDEQNSCRAGECVSSQTTCAGGVCASAAEPVVDGGVEVTKDGAVVPEDGAVVPPPAPPGPPPPTDGGTDAPYDANPANFGNTCPGTGQDCSTSTSECCYMGDFFCQTPCTSGYYAFACLGRAHCAGQYCCALPSPVGAPQQTSMCDPSGGGEYCGMNGGHYICTTDADCPPSKPTCSGVYAVGPSANGGHVKQCE